MTLILLNLGDGPGARPVDDWAIWDLSLGDPVARGDRDTITTTWPTLTSRWYIGNLADAKFADALRTGTSSLLGYGCWGNSLHVYHYGPPGRLPRYHLRRFCDLVFQARANSETNEQITARVGGLVIR